MQIENLTVDTSFKASQVGPVRNLGKIKYLVFHYTGNSGTTATAKGVARYFANCPRPASAHYAVDEGDVIYQAIPDNVVGWSVGDKGTGSMKHLCDNYNSLSIEMVSHSRTANPVFGTGDYYIPEKTLKNARILGAYLMKKYDIAPNCVIRHYDVTGKRCPEPFCGTADNDNKWYEFKEKLLLRYRTGKEEDDEVIKPISVKVLNKPITVDGVFKDNRNYVPIRIFEQIGMDVEVNNNNIPIVKAKNVAVNINGNDVKIAGFNAGGTNYASIRDIAEMLGKEVGWKDGKIIIK